MARRDLTFFNALHSIKIKLSRSEINKERNVAATLHARRVGVRAGAGERPPNRANPPSWIRHGERALCLSLWTWQHHSIT